MSTNETHAWPGQSGRTYQYYVYPIGSTFKSAGGNYIFCKKDYRGEWLPQYIGQSDNLATRLADHEKEACAKRNGATHVHAHLNANETSRLSEEKDLILKHRPTCNSQYVAQSRY